MDTLPEDAVACERKGCNNPARFGTFHRRRPMNKLLACSTVHVTVGYFIGAEFIPYLYKEGMAP